MNNPKTTSVNASHRPVLIGTLTVLLTVVFGVSLAYGMGLTKPFAVFADTSVAVPTFSGTVQSVVNYSDGVTKTCNSSSSHVGPGFYSDTSTVWDCVTQTYFIAPSTYPSAHDQTQSFSGSINYNGANQSFSIACGANNGGYLEDGTCTKQSTVTVGGEEFGVAVSGTRAAEGEGSTATGEIWPTGNCASGYTWNGTSCVQQVAAPTCHLSASPDTISAGQSSTLSWTTTDATSFSIDNGVGSVTPVDTGSKSVSPAQTTTYTGTVTGSGGTATCTATVTVTTTPPPSASCTMTATKQSDGSYKVSWTVSPNDPTKYGFYIDELFNTLPGMPVQSTTGSWTVPAPTETTTYHGTVTSAPPDFSPLPAYGHCEVTIPVTPPPSAPTCELTASPASIQKGDSSLLAWTATNATSFKIDQGIGAVTPVAAGHKTVSPTITTTYTGTATASDGQTATCHVKITVTTTQPPPAPTCTLTASPTTISSGDPSTLSWTTTNATSFSIDQNVGSVTPVASGSKIVNPTASITYTGTATGAGGTVTCKATITVTALPPGPSCTIVAFPQSIQKGASTKLYWISHNGVSFSIDQGIGSVTLSNTTGYSVSPTDTTTYTGTVTNAQGVTAVCHTTVTVTTTQLPPPTCTLSANPATISKGDTSTLTWATTYAESFSVDHGIGELTSNTISSQPPYPMGGTHDVSPTETTTYTGTATSPDGRTATCTATVTVKTSGGGGGLACTLSADPTSIARGGSSALSWTTTDATSFSIDHGVGSVSPVTSGSTRVDPTTDTTYTGTATAADGATKTCTATITIRSGGGGCTSHCGGGGGNPPPNILLSATPQPLTYLYLSQIPYTGLDLGPVGTVLYWTVLIGVTLVLAYAILFWVAPFINRKLREFAERVSLVLNAEPISPPVSMAVAQEQAAQVVIREPHIEVHSEMLLQTPEAPRGYSSFEGFKSFAKNGALSIEDLVKGLSREKISASGQQPMQAESRNVEPIYQQVEPIQNREVVAPVRAESAPADVRGLATALIGGDRNAVFAGLRQYVRGGGAPEQLVSSVAFMIDDAYRARIDGTHCDEQIARMTARFDTPTLEKLVASLTTAIDSSYSDAATGAKLAFTRALAVIHA